MSQPLPSVSEKDTQQQMPENFKTLLFTDEVKFHINNEELETATYLFGVSVRREQVAHIHNRIKALMKDHRIQTPVFHATTIFSEKHPRFQFMEDLTEMFIAERLHFFVFRYDYERLFELTKQKASGLNVEGLFNFNNADFQALFYYLLLLNTTLRDSLPELLPRDIAGYFDRNVYGVEEVEAFTAASPDFVIQRMTHSERSLISLLALPDFIGFLFHRSRRSQNMMRADPSFIESSRLTENCFQSLMKTDNAGIFHFLDIEPFYDDLNRLFPGA